MAKTVGTMNVIVFMVLIASVQNSSTETPTPNFKSKVDSIRNKSVENLHINQSVNQKSYLDYLEEGISEVSKENSENREFYRQNVESRRDGGRRPSERWTTNATTGAPNYIRKANREALITNPASKGPRWEETPISNFKKSIEDKSSANAFRSDSNGQYRKILNNGDEGDYLAPFRHRKTNKHGNSGLVNFPVLRERKPNIILILTDDQDVELGSLNFMPKTLRLLRDGGAEFRHAYVTTPMCCPSRSSLLTGMYVHNHNVFTNNENCSNIYWQQTHETRTFATYLSNAGYRTGYFGKYLNKYNGSYVPPGWREWAGLIMNSRYYNYSINFNGKKIKHGFDYYKDYYPDLIANDSITFLRQSKQYFSRKPVMLVVSFPAPHGPEDSAPQYSEMFFNVTTHHTPAYDYAPNPDKQWILQVTNKMQEIHKHFTDILMTKRLQTLQSVDSAVERIYEELKNLGELDNTYIIYTSDHGYHLGQFGLVKGKSFPFEFDVRVPFLVRGPGIEPGIAVDDIVLNIDLAPTFLDLAGVESPLHMDGRSIVRLLHHRANKRRRLKWPDTFLIESSGRRETPDTLHTKKLKQEKLTAKQSRLQKEKGIAIERPLNATRNTLEDISGISGTQQSEREGSEGDSDVDVANSEEYVSASGFRDLRYGELLIPTTSDSQVDNKIPQLVQSLAHPIPKLARLALECQSPEFQTPCQRGQKWHCVADGDRWRKYKCKFQKKCTCITPNGFMYSGLYSAEKGRKMSFGRKSSNDYEMWTQISERVDSTSLLSIMSRSGKVMSRRKRESSKDHVSDIWEDLEQELLEAQEKAANATFSLGKEPNASRCFITTRGKVNCSSLIYNDITVWKRSRAEIESKIRRLKTELEALKEIRKHLREKRPELLTSNIHRVGETVYPFEVTEVSKSHLFNQNVTMETVTNTYEVENETAFGIPTTIRYSVEATESTSPTYVTTSRESQIPTTMQLFTTRRAAEITSRRPTTQSEIGNNKDAFSNKIEGAVTIFRGRDRCLCRPDERDKNQKFMNRYLSEFTKFPTPVTNPSLCDNLGKAFFAFRNNKKELAKEVKRRIKEERLRKKERKMKKKAKLEKECLSEKMNCFIHDNEHWRTAPLWTEGPFCFCMNANNNTYSCLRTINATHNFLYCEFTTGFRTFFNLRLDPFEQLNRISTLNPDESRFLSNQLADMKACKGTKECTPREKLGYNLHYHHNHHKHHHHHYKNNNNSNDNQPHANNSATKKEVAYL